MLLHFSFQDFFGLAEELSSGYVNTVTFNKSHSLAKILDPYFAENISQQKPYRQ